MGVPFDPESEIGRLVIGKVEFSTTTTVARPQTFQVAVPSTVAKPEPSVPLSAILALVQQWEKGSEEARLSREMDADFRFNTAASDYLRADILAECAARLAALCPAPPEETQNAAL